jgi:hypothetical protein
VQRSTTPNVSSTNFQELIGEQFLPRTSEDRVTFQIAPDDSRYEQRATQESHTTTTTKVILQPLFVSLFCRKKRRASKTLSKITTI